MSYFSRERDFSRKKVSISKLEEEFTGLAIKLSLKEHRFYFLSNEEKRIHVHVESPDGVAKFWIEPIISLAVYHGLNSVKLKKIEKIVEKHKNEIIEKWQEYFGKR